MVSKAQYAMRYNRIAVKNIKFNKPTETYFLEGAIIYYGERILIDGSTYELKKDSTISFYSNPQNNMRYRISAVINKDSSKLEQLDVYSGDFLYRYMRVEDKNLNDIEIKQ